MCGCGELHVGHVRAIVSKWIGICSNSSLIKMHGSCMLLPYAFDGTPVIAMQVLFENI